MSDSIWDFLVRRLGGSMPGLESTTNVATHPIQNPAPAITDLTSPAGPITGPVGPTGPMMLDRETGRPLNEPPLPAAPPAVSQADPWEKLKQAGSQLGQIGAQRPPMSAGMAAPQVHRGQPVSLIDAVFGINKRRDY